MHLRGKPYSANTCSPQRDKDNESDNGEIGSESDSELWMPSVLTATNKEALPVNKVVADFMDAAFKQTASEDEIKGLQEKWAKPANTSMLVTPRVDDCLWKKLSPYVKKRDWKIAHVQDKLIKSVTGMSKVVGQILELKDKVKDKELKKTLKQ